jgi:hypothetical protein
VKICIMQDPIRSDLAHETVRLWIGESTMAHCISFMHNVQFGNYSLDKMQVDVGVCALLSERYGHPAWAVMSRVLPLHISSEAFRSTARMLDTHHLMQGVSKMDPEIGVAVLATKHHTMGAIHMRGTRRAVDGRISTNPSLNGLANSASDFFTRCGFPIAEIEICHPWTQHDDESCGFFFLHYLQHMLFNASVVEYEPPPEDEMKRTWMAMALFFDDICKKRFGMTMKVDETWVGVRMM